MPRSPTTFLSVVPAGISETAIYVIPYAFSWRAKNWLFV
jgi:hypothetical protein